jgi:hypothetical protein
VGHDGALVALDQGSEVVWAADDGDPGLWRRSGGVRWSGKRIGRGN